MTNIFVCFVQLIKEEREKMLSQQSFSSDLAIFGELDKIQGTSGAESFSKTAILTFLRSKGWVIDELADAINADSEMV